MLNTGEIPTSSRYRTIFVLSLSTLFTVDDWLWSWLRLSALNPVRMLISMIDIPLTSELNQLHYNHTMAGQHHNNNTPQYNKRSYMCLLLYRPITSVLMRVPHMLYIHTHLISPKVDKKQLETKRFKMNTWQSQNWQKCTWSTLFSIKHKYWVCLQVTTCFRGSVANALGAAVQWAWLTSSAGHGFASRCCRHVEAGFCMLWD